MAQQKSITQWSISETMDYLRSSIGDDNKNAVQQTQASQYLLSKLRDNAAIVEVIKSDGLDLIIKLMGDTKQDKNKNIDMALTIAICALCANPMIQQQPSEVNGMDHLDEVLKNNEDDASFIQNACNAICNYCNNNPKHQEHAIQSSISDAIIGCMDKHRGQPNGDKVHLAACLALRNIGSTEAGQKCIGPKGVTAITAGIETYFEDFNVVKGSMGVLCNLCIEPGNGSSFVQADGIKLLDKIYEDACNRKVDAIRLASSSMLHNLAANPISAPVLATHNDGEGIELMMKILKAGAIGTSLFINTLKVLTALLFKLNQDKIKIQGMQKVIDCGLLPKCNEAIASNDRQLEELVATTLVVIVQTNKHLAQQICAANCHGELIKMILKSNPTAQTKHCSMTIFFHITDNYKNQTSLMENGLLDLLSSEWYKGDTKDDTIRVGCNLLVKLLGNVKNYEHFNKKPEIKPNLKRFCSWCMENKEKNIKDQAKSIEEDINSIKE